MKNDQVLGCAAWCWLIALLGGVLAAALLMAVGGWTFLQGVFVGLVLFVVAGALLSWIMCKPLPAIGQAEKPGSAATPGVAAADAASSGSAAATSAVAGASDTSESSSGSTADESAGSAADTTAPEENALADASPDKTSAASSTPAQSSGTVGSSDIVKPSAALSGQEELASRKGTWKYEGDGSSDSGAAASAAASGGSGASAAEATPDYDGDGVLEGSGEGTRPEALSGPRDGKADNLKEIKGIGPKLEKLCNSLGFYHFDQIANWTPDEVAWVNANLEGFKGRVTRDTWVDQAKILAAGGETEFSKKVEKGGVYD